MTNYINGDNVKFFEEEGKIYKLIKVKSFNYDGSNQLEIIFELYAIFFEDFDKWSIIDNLENFEDDRYISLNQYFLTESTEECIKSNGYDIIDKKDLQDYMKLSYSEIDVNMIEDLHCETLTALEFDNLVKNKHVKSWIADSFNNYYVNGNTKIKIMY